MQLPWAKKSVRIAIGIGQDADDTCLNAFVGNPELPVLRAQNAASLSAYIRWVSTTVLKSASAPASQTNKNQTGNVPLTPPPAIDPGDAW
jgi:hypothetical protein